MTSSLDVEIDQHFLDFLHQKFNTEEKKDLLSAPIFRKEKKYERMNLKDFIDELRVRKEPYFVNMYHYFHLVYGEEYRAYKKYK